jgi:hypothetical protein
MNDRKPQKTDSTKDTAATEDRESTIPTQCVCGQVLMIISQPDKLRNATARSSQSHTTEVAASANTNAQSHQKTWTRIQRRNKQTTQTNRNPLTIKPN